MVYSLLLILIVLVSPSARVTSSALLTLSLMPDTKTVPPEVSFNVLLPPPPATKAYCD